MTSGNTCDYTCKYRKSYCFSRPHTSSNRVSQPAACSTNDATKSLWRGGHKNIGPAPFLTAGSREHKKNSGDGNLSPQRNSLLSAPVGRSVQLFHLPGLVWIVNLNACLSTSWVKTSCRRAAATVCSRPSPPPWAPKRLPPPSSSFPRSTRSHAYRCSRLTRQHGGEQSGLVTLTFDLWPFDLESGVRVTYHVGYLCANLSS